jgi:hypothetical protein
MRKRSYLILSSLAALLAIHSGFANELPFLKKGTRLVIPPHFRFYDDSQGNFVFWSSDQNEGKRKIGSHCHTTITQELAETLYYSNLATRTEGHKGFLKILGHYSLLQPLEFELFYDVAQPTSDRVHFELTTDGKPPVNNEKVMIDCELGPTGYFHKIELKNLIYNLEENFKLNVN